MKYGPQSEKVDKTAVRLLQGYPGAAVLVSANGEIEAKNSRADDLISLLRNGDLREMGPLIEQARLTRSITAGSVMMPSDQGEVLLELLIVPGEPEEPLLVMARKQVEGHSNKNAVAQSYQRYKDLVEISKDFYWETDTDGRFVYVSPQGGIGYQADELINNDGTKYLVDPDTYAYLPFISQKPMADIEMRFHSKQREIAFMRVSCVPIFEKKKGNSFHWTGVRGVCHNITDERKSESALARVRHREELLNEIISSVRHEVNPQSMLEVAVSNLVRTLEAAGCRIYRRFESETLQIAAEFGNIEKVDDLDEAIANLSDISDVRSLKLKSWQVLVATTHYRKTINGAICIWKSHKEEWIDDELLLIADVASQLGIANEQATNHERMLALSRTDPMTGLLNRRSFLEEELPRRVARLQHNHQTAALFYVDMDNFKLVNDIHGHRAGDNAIMYLRDMLMDFTRPADVIARLGGDEFAMWLDDISPDVSEVRASELIKASKSMEQFSGKPGRPLGISVGVAVYKPDQNETLDELLARADDAMYIVKREGKGGFHVARHCYPKRKGVSVKRRRKKYGVEIIAL